MLTTKHLKECKAEYNRILQSPNEYEKIDENIEKSLTKLNSIEGICTVFSCQGHYDYDGHQKSWWTSTPYFIFGYSRGSKHIIDSLINDFRENLHTFENYPIYASFNVPYLDSKKCISVHINQHNYNNHNHSPEKDLEIEKEYNVFLEKVSNAFDNAVNNNVYINL
jgi:hypothetical protein